jgi:hypothetical protein
MQGEVTTQGGRAETTTFDSSDSDCKVTGTSQFETLDGEANGPMRSEAIEKFTHRSCTAAAADVQRANVQRAKCNV